MKERTGCAVMAALQLVGLAIAIWWTVKQWNAGSNWCIVHFIVAAQVCAMIAYAVSAGLVLLFDRD